MRRYTLKGDGTSVNVTPRPTAILWVLLVPFLGKALKASRCGEGMSTVNISGLASGAGRQGCLA